jgi:hypothetical protein
MTREFFEMIRSRTIHDYYQEAEAKIQSDVAARSDEGILGIDTAEYTEYLFAKYALAPVERDESRDIQTELSRQAQSYTDPWGDLVQGEVQVAKIEYPIILHSTTEKVLTLLPSVQKASVPEYEFRHDRLILRVPLPFLYASSDSPPTGSREITSALKNLEWCLNSRNEDIRELNPKLRSAIGQIVEARKIHIAKTRSDFEAIIKQVNVPLKLKPSAQDTVVSLPVRQELKPILKPPTPKRPEEYTLKKEEVSAVVEFIKRWGRSLEATPQAIAGLDEEDIRALILAQLNGVVDGGATGESFSKLGKTDIHLNLPKGDILVAECKIWRGAKAYRKAIDQAFGYLTWRQCYVIIIAFVRNKDFTNVLTQAQKAIQAHQTYQGQLKEQSESHFVSQHVFPDDPNRSVEVHHLFSHFPPSN